MDDWELRDRANKDKATAIRLDSMGLKAMAIEYYQRAYNDLFNLARIYDGIFHETRIWIES